MALVRTEPAAFSGIAATRHLHWRAALHIVYNDSNSMIICRAALAEPDIIGKVAYLKSF